jgi:hypothetical protein
VLEFAEHFLEDSRRWCRARRPSSTLKRRQLLNGGRYLEMACIDRHRTPPFAHYNETLALR